MFATPIRPSSFYLFIRPRIPKGFLIRIYHLDGLIDKNGFRIKDNNWLITSRPEHSHLRKFINNLFISKVKLFSTKKTKKKYSIDNIELNCLIHGDTPAGERIFSIDIARSRTVLKLKELIKEKNPTRLGSIEAQYLTLWSVNIPADKIADNALDLLKLKSDSKDIQQLAGSLKRLSSYFPENPAEENIHVIVEPPLATDLPSISIEKKRKAEELSLPPILMKQNIANAFPNGLPYVAPKPLLSTKGLHWEYQPGPTLHQILRDELRKQYKSFCAGYGDKTTMPLYLFLAGAGTGKSRHATEFHRTVIKCLGTEDEELKNKLQNAWVFHTSFENGTSFAEGELNAFRAIGSRMLLQLLPGKSLKDIVEKYEAPDPLSVLELVAKHQSQNLKDATIILAVDGLQNIMGSYDDGLNASSQFYTTLTSIGDLAARNSFLLPCCTATVSRPVDQVFRPSNRRRIFLPVTPLEPPSVLRNHTKYPVFETGDPMVNLLVNDCGGHGRVLEILEHTLERCDIRRCDLGDLMRKLRDELLTLYRSAVRMTPEEARALTRAVITRQRLHIDKLVPNTAKTPDQFVSPGLVKFVETDKSGAGHFIAPYIWIWAVTTTESGKSLLPEWQFDDYDENLSKIDKTRRLAICTWDDFERFNASFRCMKSQAIGEGELAKISDIHYGAQLNGDIEFKNHHLELENAAHRTDTSSNSKEPIICQNGIIDVRQCKHLIINAIGAGFGDVYCGLDTPDNTPVSNEVQQYKFFAKTKLTQHMFEDERKKATSGNDFFLVFTTDKSCDIKLLERSGIVHGRNWDDYFGPFSGRMFMNTDNGNPLNINTATHSLLQLVVKAKDADKIVSKRPFANVEEAMEKTRIKESLLKRFRYL